MLRRLWHRHKWSLTCSLLSLISFAQLAFVLSEGELSSFDRAVTQSVAPWRGQIDGLMLAFTRTGDGPGMALLCALSALGLFRFERRKDARFVLVCGVGALLLSSGLKLLFHRARPLAADLYLLHAPDSFSFPSGHALGSISVVGSLAVVVNAARLPRHWRALATAFALLFVVGVALSRVYFGVHFPSDVVGGDLAGAAWVAAATGWFYPRLLPGETAGPAPAAAR
jgi:undecaprenyl-diphosphatase